MHLLVQDSVTLDEDAAAVDLGQASADVVMLSFSESDLGAAASGWQTLPAPRPGLMLANLARLRHPLSVDLYAEQVIAGSGAVVVRVLGGLDYFRYGAEEFAQACRDRAIPLALLSGDDRPDARLAALSTMPHEALATLDVYVRAGGPNNFAHAILFAARQAGRFTADVPPPAPLPQAGEHALGVHAYGPTGLAVLVFYRSQLLAGDIAPIHASAEALHARGLGVRALFVSSLKEPQVAAWVAERLHAWQPTVVVNATMFSAGAAPLNAANVPVLQLVLSGSTRAAWAASGRGLAQADMAMQVVLPELDGRLLTTAVSFKAPAEPLPGLDFSRQVHCPDPDGVALAADRAAGWARLAATPAVQRRVAIVLSNYPGGQAGHAVGLDSFASLDAMAELLANAGYTVAPLGRMREPGRTSILSLAAYRSLFATLPHAVQTKILDAWGEPDGDFDVACVPGPGVFAVLQPERGHVVDRKAGYHDPDLPPCHAYVAFYLWLRHVVDVHAVVQLGAHGTLEWLPGKAAAPSADCFPISLLRGVPVIYPFIVSNPGEAAAAKRRLGAVVIGHLTPAVIEAGAHGDAAVLERLIDEYAAADGLDWRRADLLRMEILDRAADCGLLAESGVAQDAAQPEALARLDAYLCDVKTLRIRDGLHVFGRAPAAPWGAVDLHAGQQACAGAERAALLAALDGRFVAPGPAGAPTRGRTDVLPTGRNLYSIDPRAVPTRSAVRLAERAADELLRRHRQDHGDWPRSLVLDVWGSATMRTGGEDFALAWRLMGVRPRWDEGSARICGFDIVPLALLDRPRVDVTLRISGLFRDAFESLVALFDQSVRALADRDEAADFNPLAQNRSLPAAARRLATTRVFGPAPCAYGAGVVPLLERGAWSDRAELGASYLAASSFAYGRDLDGDLPAAFSQRVAAADAFVHIQDHAETDLLDSTEYAAHEGGFAAAADRLGGAPALYHLDTSQPDAARVRGVAEEVARVVRARAANPRWLAGMMRHGRSGAAEIARSVQVLHAFAATVPERFDTSFDVLFDATCGDPETEAFVRAANPQAHAAMVGAFRDAGARGLWHARRNDVALRLADTAP